MTTINVSIVSALIAVLLYNVYAYIKNKNIYFKGIIILISGISLILIPANIKSTGTADEIIDDITNSSIPFLVSIFMYVLLRYMRMQQRDSIANASKQKLNNQLQDDILSLKNKIDKIADNKQSYEGSIKAEIGLIKEGIKESKESISYIYKNQSDFIKSIMELVEIEKNTQESLSTVLTKQEFNSSLQKSLSDYYDEYHARINKDVGVLNSSHSRNIEELLKKFSKIVVSLPNITKEIENKMAIIETNLDSNIKNSVNNLHSSINDIVANLSNTNSDINNKMLKTKSLLDSYDGSILEFNQSVKNIKNKIDTISLDGMDIDRFYKTFKDTMDAINNIKTNIHKIYRDYQLSQGKLNKEVNSIKQIEDDKIKEFNEVIQRFYELMDSMKNIKKDIIVDSKIIQNALDSYNNSSNIDKNSPKLDKKI